MLAMLVAVILWGSSFVAMKIAVQAFSPLAMTWGRMGCSLLALVLIQCFLWMRGEGFVLYDAHLSRRDWMFILLLALCEPCLYFVFESYAIQYTTASQAGMIVAILPLAVVGIGWIFFNEKPGKGVLFGVLLALVGVVWLSAGAIASESAPNPVLGNGLEVLAMGCSALYVLCVKKIGAHGSPLLLTAVQVLVGFLFFLPFQAMPFVAWPESFELLPVLAVIYLGVVVTLVAFVMYNYALRHAPAARIGGYLNLTPVFSLLFGVLFLGESLTPGQWAASALVFLGVCIGQKTPGESA